MPYWDWTKNPEVPKALTDPTLNDGSANPLYDSTRQSGVVPAELTGQSVMNNIYLQKKFESFASSSPSGQNSTSGSWQRKTGTQGPLEATPHNGVHNWLGGNMSTFFSPADPIFWLHHSNVDRVWNSWNNQGNLNTTNNYWRNFSFSNNFAKSDGTLYSILVKDISNSSYSYEYLDAKPSKLAGTFASESAFAPKSEWFDVAAAGSVPVPGTLIHHLFRVSNDKSAALGRPASILVGLQGMGRQLSREAALRLRNIQAPLVANAPFIRVFLNHPSIGPDTPPSGPYYVGTVSFFGTPAQHAASHMSGGTDLFSFELPLTRTLADQRSLGQPIPDALTVQIVPVALGATVQQVEIKPTAVEVEFF